MSTGKEQNIRFFRAFEKDEIAICLTKCVSIDLKSNPSADSGVLEFTAKIKISHEENSGLWICDLPEEALALARATASEVA